MIRTLLVDDENLIRQTLKMYLELAENIEVVGSAENGKRAIALVEELAPDIVLMDIEMPEMDGLTVTKLLCDRFPESKIIILSSHDNSEYLDRALSAGAKGYLLKSTSPEDLSQSIELINKGYLQLAPELSLRLALTNMRSPEPIVDRTESFPLPVSNTENTNVINRDFSDRLKLNYDERTLPQNVELSLVAADDFLPPISRWTNRGAIVLLGIFGTALCLTNVLKFKTTVKAPVQIRPVGELRVVQAATAGTVTSIEAEANQKLERGDIIAIVDSSQLQTQKSQQQQKLEQSKANLVQTKAQIADLDRQINIERASIQRLDEFDRVDTKLSQQEYEQRLVTAQTELETATAGVNLAQEELARFQQLEATGAISKLQISQKKAALQESIAKQKQAQAKIVPSEADLLRAKEDTAQKQTLSQTRISSLNRDRKTLIEKQVSLSKQFNQDRAELQQITKNIEETVVRATASGTVQELNLRNQGQIVNSGEAIATIAPDRSTQLAIANVTTQDIGRVKVDRETQIKVSACPYPDYGILSGVVQNISPDAFEIETATGNSSFYQVAIEPEHNFVGTPQHKCALKSGMSGSVDIITQNETVLSFLVRKARLKINL